VEEFVEDTVHDFQEAFDDDDGATEDQVSE
jgi:hypothetical protein